MGKESKLNSQVGGDHYKKLGEYQPWIVLSKWMTQEELKGAMKKDVISYLQREASKGGIEDIKKAYHTLGIYLELVNSESKVLQF
jgi:GH15 family glucan-1,4-alpha-glucosidase